MTVGPDGRAWTADEIAEHSATELAAGRLPTRAQWRLAEQKERADRGEPGAFTSDLTVDEFAAIRSVGFSPVGQVLGSAVYNLGWNTTGCGYGGGRYGGFGRMPPGFGGPLQYGAGPWGTASVVAATGTQQLLNEARHRATARMVQECAALGGDGVVGVRLTIAPFYGNGLEFFAIGTAVRAEGPRRPATPFTCDLTGQDFAKLLRAGWVPVSFVQGVASVMRHNDWQQQSQSRSWTNQEIHGQTALVQAARDQARKALAADAKQSGGHTVLLRDSMLQVFETRCTSAEGEDHLANMFMWGTAIVPYAKHPVSERPLTMLRLSR
jgi:uncharacterized protein YbjQ (UPF0145 family)